MAEITCTLGDVAMTAPLRSEVYNVTISGCAASGVILPGQALYQMSNGVYALAAATASGIAGFRGVALQRQVTGATLSMMKQGKLYGYDLSGMNHDAPVYLSDTPGVFSDTPGSIEVRVGRVVSLNEAGNLEKLIYFDSEYAATELG